MGILSKLRKKSKPSVIEDLDVLLADAIREKEVLHSLWTSWWKYVDGKQDDNIDFEDWQLQDFCVVNLCKSYVQTVLPILLSSYPAPFVVADDMCQDELAVAVTEVLHALRDRLRIDWTLHQVYTDALSIGTGVAKVWWDKNGGPVVDGDRQGEVALAWVDPFSVYPDRTARTREDCEYIAVCNKYSLARIRRLFPDKDINADDLGSSAGLPIDDIRAPEGVSNITEKGMMDAQGKRVEATYDIWEVYHEFGDRLTIYSGKTLIWDGDNPTPNARFPLFFFPLNPQGHKFWGEPTIKDMVGLQKLINLTNMRISTHARLMGNAQWLTNDANFAATNEPGGIATYHGDLTAQRVPATPLPDYYFSWLQMLFSLTDIVSGVHDVTRGQRPPGVQSGIAIQELQQAGISRLSLPVTDFAQVLEDMWQAILDIISANYLDQRTVAYARGQDTKKVTVGPEYFGQRNEGKPEEVIPYKYRVIVQASGDLPISQAARLEQAMRFMGVLPPSALVEQLKWPMSDKLIADLKEKEALQEQMQMAQMQMQMVTAEAQIEMIQAQAAQAQAQATEGQNVPPLEEVFNPDEVQVLTQIAGKMGEGIELSEEEDAFLKSLPAEDLAVAEAHLQGGGQAQGGG